MAQDAKSQAQAAAEHVIGLEEELEASGYAALEDEELARLRLVLHRWVDEVRGLVVSPALGRVTLIDPNGRKTSIFSPQLAYTLSAPVSSPTPASER